jgi:hypothetical protein
MGKTRSKKHFADVGSGHSFLVDYSRSGTGGQVVDTPFCQPMFQGVFLSVLFSLERPCLIMHYFFPPKEQKYD